MFGVFELFSKATFQQHRLEQEQQFQVSHNPWGPRQTYTLFTGFILGTEVRRRLSIVEKSKS